MQKTWTGFIWLRMD